MEIPPKAVEAAAIAIRNIDEGLPPGDPWASRLISEGRDAEHAGDCTNQNFTCNRCLYIHEMNRARDVLAAALPFLAMTA